MSQNFNITMKQYNGTDYDVLYPATVDSQIDLSSEVQNYYPNGYTFEDVLVQNAQRTEGIGTIRITTRDDLDSSWVPCDGSVFDNVEYPELAKVIQHDITDTLLTKNLTLPAETYSTIDGNSYSYCNGRHIFAFHANAAPSNVVYTTESLFEPQWTGGGSNISSAILNSVIYVDDFGMYFASNYINNMKQFNAGLYKSTDLLNWSIAVPGDGTYGIYTYSPSDKCFYKFCNVKDGTYVKTVLYKTSDFSSWTEVYSDNSSIIYDFSLSIVASNKYIYFSRLWNTSDSKYYIYDISSGQVVNVSTPPDSRECVAFVGEGDFIVMLAGSYTNNTCYPANAYYCDGNTYSFDKMSNGLSQLAGIPKFIMTKSYLVVYTNGGYTYAVDFNGNVIADRANFFNTIGTSYDGNYFYSVNNYFLNSANVRVGYSSNTIPLLRLPNATAYIKATPTPATTT